jgi:hypothetical protein
LVFCDTTRRSPFIFQNDRCENLRSKLTHTRVCEHQSSQLQDMGNMQFDCFYDYTYVYCAYFYYFTYERMSMIINKF